MPSLSLHMYFHRSGHGSLQRNRHFPPHWKISYSVSSWDTTLRNNGWCGNMFGATIAKQCNNSTATFNHSQSGPQLRLGLLSLRPLQSHKTFLRLTSGFHNSDKLFSSQHTTPQQFLTLDTNNFKKHFGLWPYWAKKMYGTYTYNAICESLLNILQSWQHNQTISMFPPSIRNRPKWMDLHFTMPREPIPSYMKPNRVKHDHFASKQRRALHPFLRFTENQCNRSHSH